jgi:hypothetical protein
VAQRDPRRAPLRGGRRRPAPGVTVALKHFKFDSLEHAFSKFNRYTSVEADERRAASLTSTPAEALTDAVAEFTRRYSPEEDGSLSLALSMGFFTYR